MQFRSLLATLVLCLAIITPIRGAENTVTLDIEPTKENPRNSEGAFVTLNSGRLLFYYTQFYGGGSDESPARIVEIHSDDRGYTWSEPREVIENIGETMS